MCTGAPCTSGKREVTWMARITAAARSVGMLADVDFIEPQAAAELPAEHVLYLCTGSQGEPLAGLSRMAAGDHRHFRGPVHRAL